MSRAKGTARDRHYAYLLRCADGSFYAGYTVDPHRRLAAHLARRASRYTRSRLAVALAAVWRCPDRRAALALERLLKRLSHGAKHRLAAGLPDAALTGGARALGARRLRVRSSAYATIEGLTTRPPRTPAAPSRAARIPDGRRSEER